jgi:hypothetical protein
MRFCLWFAFLLASVNGLKISSQSIEGTEPVDHGLSDKQLGIQRYLAQLTFLSPDLNDWTNWGESVHDVHCDGNTCIRYEIAGLAYAAAILGMKTPSYSQVAEEIMFSSILRMFQPIVWKYIELFDNFKEQESYPDPVAYKNIMYSGHLVQMIAMFETLFGNFSFSTTGWDFIWLDSLTNETLVMHYNTSLLMRRVYEESLAYGINGVPCEPDSIFVICNNYPQNGWLLFDSLYQTNYTLSSIPSWAKTIQQHGINPQTASRSDTAPAAEGEETDREIVTEREGSTSPGSLENYFKLDYLIKPVGIWEPIATIGSDLWALSWMKTWWPVEDLPSSLQSAFDFILESSCWSRVTAQQEGDLEEPRAGQSLLPYSYLHPSEQSQKLFPFDDMITTSFYPLLDRQFLSSTDSLSVGRYGEVMNFFESEFGQSLDLNGDGVGDVYQYNAIRCPVQQQVREEQEEGMKGGASPYALCESGDYAIWATSNLLIGMIHPKDDLDFLRRLFHPTEGGRGVWFRKFQNQSKVERVEYPHVMVSYAHYSTSPSSSSSSHSLTHNLTVVLKPGDSPPIGRSHTVTLSHIPAKAEHNLSLTIRLPSEEGEDVVVRSTVVQEDNDAKEGQGLGQQEQFIKLLVEVPGWGEAEAKDSLPIVIELLY